MRIEQTYFGVLADNNHITAMHNKIPHESDSSNLTRMRFVLSARTPRLHSIGKIHVEIKRSDSACRHSRNTSEIIESGVDCGNKRVKNFEENSNEENSSESFQHLMKKMNIKMPDESLKVRKSNHNLNEILYSNCPQVGSDLS